NYLVFYLPDELQGTVSVMRIMYEGRDIEKQLGD
ncbi:MAG: type II toxin-antitoxin system RelE/ParE family toxin, partial [Defluviitaleaceae bacterium]|nr:type II toxin-antitoxin system RelE/ParE family toxin [Defluviitaleaceae bacterium]